MSDGFDRRQWAYDRMLPPEYWAEDEDEPDEDEDEEDD
ncbi:MAG: hypothetical protein JWO67_6499 [Streptosporangiaceae bacterium]|nr:hypothetical protein [Streptosporangiaceae bacterium]